MWQKRRVWGSSGDEAEAVIQGALEAYQFAETSGVERGVADEHGLDSREKFEKVDSAERRGAKRRVLRCFGLDDHGFESPASGGCATKALGMRLDSDRLPRAASVFNFSSWCLS